MKIFVDTDSDIRLVRRLRRDITERGRDIEGVIKQYNKFVKPAFDQYIEPTMRLADIVVPRGKSRQWWLCTVVWVVMITTGFWYRWQFCHVLFFVFVLFLLMRLLTRVCHLLLCFLCTTTLLIVSYLSACLIQTCVMCYVLCYVMGTSPLPEKIPQQCTWSGGGNMVAIDLIVQHVHSQLEEVSRKSCWKTLTSYRDFIWYRHTLRHTHKHR